MTAPEQVIETPPQLPPDYALTFDVKVSDVQLHVSITADGVEIYGGAKGIVSEHAEDSTQLAKRIADWLVKDLKTAMRSGILRVHPEAFDTMLHDVNFTAMANACRNKLTFERTA